MSSATSTFASPRLGGRRSSARYRMMLDNPDIQQTLMARRGGCTYTRLSLYYSSVLSMLPNIVHQEQVDPMTALIDPDPTTTPLLLRQMTIQWFRSLHAVGPVTLQSGLTVVTGENDGGKSAFVDAIAVLLGERSADEGDHSAGASPEDDIEIEGLLSVLDDPAAEASVRVRVRKRRGEQQTREIADRVHGAFGASPATLPIAELRGCMAAQTIPVPSGQQKAPIIAAAEAWLATRPTSEFREHWRPLVKSDESRLPAFGRFDSAVAPSPTETVRTVILQEAKRLLADPRYATRFGALSGELDAEIAPSLEYLRAKIGEYCPDLDSVEVRASFNFTRPTLQVQLQVQRKGKAYDLEKAGEGRRRRISLGIYEANLRALAEETPSIATFLAYDEPDTHLDYASQRALFDILNQQARLPHVQVLVASHSLNFIDKVPLQSLLHFRLGEDLGTTVKTLTSHTHADELEHFAAICTSLGLRNSVLLDERCFLVIEGETEGDRAEPDRFRHQHAQHEG